MSTTKHSQDSIMSQIIAVRFTDPDRELSLCRSLLTWAETQNDLYAKAFALTYIGDYYIGQNDSESAGPPLLEALQIMGNDDIFNPIKLRTCNLLALYFEMRADEQSSTQYYLESLAASRKTGDTDAECTVLNNLAYAFWRHRRRDEALKYFHQAYQLQVVKPETPLRLLLLSNLAEVSIALGQLEDAHKYITACMQIQLDPISRDCHLARNWCCYYTALGDYSLANQWAGRALSMTDQYLLNRMSAFENFNLLCQSMIEISNQDYARRLLSLLDQISEGDNLDQLKLFEELKISYARAFNKPEHLAPAYRRYYDKTRELQKRADQAISSAMKSQISLSEALLKSKNLERKQKQLERQTNTDDLTGLRNRRFLEKALKSPVDRANAAPSAIIMLDVDYFKEYNDFYGHQLGDSALQTVASCLKAHQIPGIEACRFGGDEFTCLCSGLSHSQVVDYIRAVRADLANRKVPHKKSACSRWLTLSIGYAQWEKTTEANLYPLLQQADQALYESKQAGRNSYFGRQVDSV